jgi:hypothetical protein
MGGVRDADPCTKKAVVHGWCSKCTVAESDRISPFCDQLDPLRTAADALLLDPRIGRRPWDRQMWVSHNVCTSTGEGAAGDNTEGRNSDKGLVEHSPINNLKSKHRED